MKSIVQTTQHKSPTAKEEKELFKNEILHGLSKKNKKIPSKYFYDERGSELFNQISHHPDYYLTGCELEILATHKKKLSHLLKIEPFNLIELGPGEGIKTQLLIKQFLQDELSFTYYPIDISKNYLNILVSLFNQRIPDLNLMALHADYFEGIKWLKSNIQRRNLVLFLGSSIGNFNSNATKKFLSLLWHSLQANDYVLIGFDLRKDIDIILRAYNDCDGLTSNFNLNLLQRINRELDANFAIDKFRHYETYNVNIGAMESYLVSLEAQTVAIEGLDRTFTFKPYEAIHVEYSFKYLLSQIKKFSQVTGFEIVENFFDSKKYFVDSLWRVKK